MRNTKGTLTFFFFLLLESRFSVTHYHLRIYTCIRMVTNALSGNYINFGVFGLYGDPALNNALDMIIKLSLSIPLQELMVNILLVNSGR